MSNSGDIDISPDVEKRLLAIIAKESAIDTSEIKLESRLEDLSIESADVMLILMAIEEEFGVYLAVNDELSEAETVKDFVTAITSHINSAEK